MPADQFDRWKQFYLRTPFDPESLYHLPAAMISSTLINCHGGRDGRAVSPRDLMRNNIPPSPDEVDEKLKARFAQLMAPAGRRTGAEVT